MKQYHELAQYILDNGNERGDRTGTGTKSVFGYQMRFNLEEGFPLITTKTVNLRLVFEELMWFLRGETNARKLAMKNVNIWTPDAYRWYQEQGSPHGEMTMKEFKEWLKDNDWDLGSIYGSQWRSWQKPDYGQMLVNNTVDQISNVIRQIKESPNSRRLIVSAWNPGEIEDMALPPCHVMFQFYVHDGKLSCQLYQR